MVNPGSGKAQLFQLLPSLEGLTLEEAAERIGLSPATMAQYLYELGGAVVGLERGKIRVNDTLVAAATQEGERHSVHGRPALSQREQRRRNGPAWISIGGLSRFHLNMGSAWGTWEINSFQRDTDELSREDNEEILKRIVREGTAGTGERLG